MDLIAISYQNIGPFENQLLTIFFDQGNYLIKAPIGRGKSFLFFDGPMYGLYKYSSRNVLNIKSSTGFIKLIFSANDENYLVIRNLKSGKSKDSCSSRLYKIEGIIHLDQTIKNKDIEDLLVKDPSIRLEELVFKNETDLQQSLASFLPEREVFLSTAFLMQDAPNIFELQPAERMTVLKSVFNLLSIDNATEVVAERRKEIQAQIKVLSDDSSYNDKLKVFLRSYLTSYKELKSNPLTAQFFSSEEFFQELTILVEKLNINEFSTNDFPHDIAEEISILVEQKKEHYQKLGHQAESINKTLTEENIQLTQYKQNEKTLTAKVAELEQKIGNIDQSKLKDLKEKKLHLISSQQTLHQSVDQNQMFDFFQKNASFFADVKINGASEIDLKLANILVEKLKNTGLILRSEQNTIQAQIDKLGQQKSFLDGQLSDLSLSAGSTSHRLYSMEIDKQKRVFDTEISSLDTEIASLTEKKSSLEERLSILTAKLDDFQKSFDSQKIFNCEKIGTNCPFIERINQKTFQELEKQKNLLDQEKISLENKIKEENLAEQITNKTQKKNLITKNSQLFLDHPETFLKEFLDNLETKKAEILQKMKDENFEQKLKDLEAQKNLADSHIVNIKSFLEIINRKQLQADHDILLQTQSEEKSLDQAIIQMENELAKIESYKTEKDTHLADLKSVKEHIQKFTEKIATLETEAKNITQEIKDFDYQTILTIEKLNQKMVEATRDIQKLVDDFQSTQLKVKDLQEDEKIIKELHKVFSKELLLVVLQDHLPTLNDIINAFLGQVVDYQIKFELNQTGNQLELLAQIYDEKGNRDVKSLSGGQRVILKLVWMLAISSYMNAKMLFLDETINNLDQDTVGKVADMLTDFVKSRSMKLYTVTHSQQIHDMKIWDRVIEI